MTVTTGGPRKRTLKEEREAAREEAAAAVEYEKAQRAAIPAPEAQAPPVTADDYVHAVHPDTGLDVVFVPGETLPDWVAPAG